VSDASGTERVEDLLPELYGELKKIARSLMWRERDAGSLQTTGLVNEACLRLLRLRGQAPRDRRAFFALAATAMRRVLVDQARRRDAAKRWPSSERVAFEHLEREAASFFGYPRLEFIELDRALEQLGRHHPRKARVVELLYFVGLTREETAQVLGVTRRTVDRDWRIARLRLIRGMVDG